MNSSCTGSITQDGSTYYQVNDVIVPNRYTRSSETGDNIPTYIPDSGSDSDGNGGTEGSAHTIYYSNTLFVMGLSFLATLF